MKTIKMKIGHSLSNLNNMIIDNESKIKAFKDFEKRLTDLNKYNCPYICTHKPDNDADIVKKCSVDLQHAFGSIDSFDSDFTNANVKILNNEILGNINLDDYVLGMRAICEYDKNTNIYHIIKIISFDLLKNNKEEL